MRTKVIKVPAVVYKYAAWQALEEGGKHETGGRCQQQQPDRRCGKESSIIP